MSGMSLHGGKGLEPDVNFTFISTESRAYTGEVQIFTDSSRSWMLFSFKYFCQQGADQTRIPPAPKRKMMPVGKYMIHCRRLCQSAGLVNTIYTNQSEMVH